MKGWQLFEYALLVLALAWLLIVIVGQLLLRLFSQAGGASRDLLIWLFFMLVLPIAGIVLVKALGIP